MKALALEEKTTSASLQNKDEDVPFGIYIFHREINEFNVGM